MGAADQLMGAAALLGTSGSRWAPLKRAVVVAEPGCVGSKWPREEAASQFNQGWIISKSGIGRSSCKATIVSSKDPWLVNGPWC